MRFAVTTLSLVFISLTPHLVSSAESVRSLNSPLNIEEISEDKLMNDGSFIIPNEHNNYAQYKNLPMQLNFNSAVISVGTVRAFNLAGVLRRDLLITLDYDEQVRLFNDALAKLISVSSRAEFLKTILGLRSPIVSRELILNEYLSGKPQSLNSEGQLFYDFFTPQNPAEPKTKSGAEFTIWKKWWPGFDPASRETMIWISWQTAILTYAKSEQSWNSTFFGSDESYDHVRHLIKTERFFSIRGSLTGARSLRAIGEFLRKKNYWVSELDTSNALEHVYKYEKHNGLQNFINNVMDLPFNSSSNILSTHSLNVATPNSHLLSTRSERHPDWLYGITPVKNVAALAQASIDSDDVNSPKLSDPFLRCESVFR